MSRRKIRFYIVALTLATVVLAAELVYVFVFKKDTSQYITAEAWMEMLCEHTGSDPVDLPDGYKDGDYADAKLIAVTAFETIDAHKLRRVIGDTELTDKEYCKLADDYELLSAKKDGYTSADCEKILERYNEIYFDDLWLDDYCEAEYKENVKHVEALAAAQENEADGTVRFDGNPDLSQGDVLVYKDDLGFMHTGRVDAIGEDGSCQLSEPAIEDVIDSVEVSDIREISYQDIYANNTAYPADAVISDSGKSHGGSSGAYMHAMHNENKVLSYSNTSAGLQFTVEAEEDELTVTMRNKDTGEEVKYKSDIELGDGASGSLDVDLSDIEVAADMTYFTFQKGEKYAEYRLQMDSTVTGSLSLATDDDALKIPLFETTVPFEGGFVRLDFGVYLQLTAEGTYEITATLPMNICVRHDKTDGLRMLKGQAADSSIEQSLQGEAMLSANAEARLWVFFLWDLLGAEVKAGAVGTAQIIERDDGMICKDISVDFPVIKGSAYLSGLFSQAEKEFDIYSGNTVWNYHSEYIPGVRDGRVPECSYGNEELLAEYAVTYGNQEPQPDISILYGHDLYSKFETNLLSVDEYPASPDEPAICTYWFDITDTGSGYELVGKLTIQDRLSDAKYQTFVEQAVDKNSCQDMVNEEMSSESNTAYDHYYTVNDTTMTNLGVTYTMQSYMENYNGRPHCDFIGDNGKTAGVHNDLVPMYDSYGEGYWELGGEDIVIENAHIFVPYGTGVEEIIKGLCEQGGSNGNPTMEWFGIKLDEQGNVSAIESWRP
ncbi:MAG: hypothetical protein J6C99_03020 [Lachnospiraceae bacterium]|nr:hypothetical protein [Lachnospiraceae bacterium]